jgi:adenylate kinase family enzyme
MSGTFNSFIKAANKQRAVEASYLLTGLPIPNTEAAQLYNTGTGYGDVASTAIEEKARQTDAQALQYAQGFIDWLNEDQLHPPMVQGEIAPFVDFELAVDEAAKAINGRGTAAVRGTWMQFRDIPSKLKKTVSAQALRRIEHQISAMIALEGGASPEDFTHDPVVRGYMNTFQAMSPSVRQGMITGLRKEYLQTEAGYEQVEASIDRWARQRQAAMYGRQIDFTDIRDLRDFADWGATNLVPALGTMVGAFGAGLVGGAPGVWAYGAAMSTAEIAGESDLRDIEDLNAANRALLFGILSGGVELIGAAPRALAAKGILRQQYSDVTQDVMSRVSRGYARRLGREAVASGVEEFLQEGAQFMLEQAGVEGADFRLDDETLLGAFNAAMVGLFAGGAFGTAFNVRQQVALERDAQRKRDVGLTVQSVEELAAVTQDLKLPEQSKAAFSSLVDKLGLGNTKFFYQAEAIQQFVETKQLDLEQTLGQLGIKTADFMQALANGTRLPITGAGLVQAGLTKDADVAFWSQNAATRPDGDTAVDLEALDENRKTIIAELREQVEIGARSPSRQQLERQITDRAVAAGMRPEVAGAQATALAAVYETLAARYGGGDMSGADLFERFGFQVNSGVSEASPTPPPTADVASVPRAAGDQVMYQSPVANDRTVLQQLVDQGAAVDQILDNQQMAAAVAEMQALPETMSEAEASVFDNFTNRTYTDPKSGENLTYPEMIDAVNAVSKAYAKGPIRQERRIDLLIGPPAAGKSTIANAIAPEIGARIVDPDDIKKFVPGYEGGIGAMAVHEESSALSKQILEAAMVDGDNIVWPKVGENPDKIRALVARLQEQGYEVNLVNMRVNRDEAFRRMVSRFIYTGRVIPPRYAYEVVGNRPTETYEQLREEGIADGYADYDNEVPYGSPARIIEDSRRPSGRPVPAGAGEGGADAGLRAAQGARVLFQSASLRRGTEDLTDYGIQPGGKYKVRALGAAFEARTRALYGTIDKKDRSPEAMERIAQWMVDEVVFEYETSEAAGNSAVGWYSVKYQAALDTVAEMFPELAPGADMEGTAFASPQDARAFLTALVAITSDGEKVYTNWSRAIALYAEARETGKVPEDTQATRGASIRINAQLINALHEKYGAGMQAYLLEEVKVSALNKELRAKGLRAAKYPAGRTLPRSAAYFGPKLGAFYANLSGAEGYLTMDRWWSRTFNRYRGTLVLTPTEEGKARVKRLLGNPEMSDDQMLSEASEYAASYAAKGYDNGTELEVAANTVYRAAFEKLQDQPFNIGDRGFMIDTVGRAQELLLSEHGINTSVADIQAILWYYEKRLYAEMGARASPDVSYEEVAHRVIEEMGGLGGPLLPGTDATGDVDPGSETVLYQMDARGDAGRGDPREQTGGSPALRHAGGSRSGARPADPETFVRAARMGLSKMGPIAAQVGTDPGDQAFLLDDGLSGYALAGDNIISVFSSPSSPPGVAGRALRDAISKGGRRLDGFDTYLPGLYAKHGFRAVARLGFNDEYAPAVEDGAGADWDYDAMSSWAGGRPDVVFMVYDPENASPDTANVVEDYDAGIAAQDEALAMLDQARQLRQPVPRTGQSVIDTPAFKEFFGDSKVVDENGDPLMVYRGEHGATDTGQPQTLLGSLTFSDQESASHYAEFPNQGGYGARAEAPRVTPAYLSIQNPIVFDGVDPFIDLATLAEAIGMEKATALALKHAEAFTNTSRWMEDINPEGSLTLEDYLENRLIGELEIYALAYPLLDDPEVVAALQEAGYDGAIHGGIGEFDATEYRVFDVSQIKSPFNEGGFDRATSDILHQAGPRGLISLPTDGSLDQGVVIKLMESADASTLLHEAGHYFLELFTELASDRAAPEQMRQDLAAIHRWMGKSNPIQPYTTEQHEQFAEAFEQYLMEGKAPSVGLRAVFSLFKRWLTKIYQASPMLQQHLTPEIRDVFDRLLATDEEIELAKIEESMGPLFIQKPEGMADADYEGYRRSASMTDAEGAERLFAKALKTVKAKRTKEWKATREKLRAEHTERLAAKPVHQLVARLKKDDIRLNRQEVIDQFDKEIADELLKYGRGKAAILTNQGTSLEVVADLAGYPSIDEMITDLYTSQPLAVEVESAVVAEQEEELEDITTSGKMREEAIAALHNNRRWQTLVMEGAELRRQVEEAGEAPPATLSIPEMRALAKAIISDTSVAIAEDPEVYLRAERKAGRDARTAFSRVHRASAGASLAPSAAKDLIEAHTAVRRQLLNSMLYAEARGVQKTVQQIKRQERLLRRKDAARKITSPFIEQITSLLQQYDFRKMSRQETFKRHDLIQLIQMMEDQGFGDVLAIRPDTAKRVKRMPYRALTVSQLRDLQDTLQNLETMGRREMKAHIEEREEAFHEVKRGVLNTIGFQPDVEQSLSGTRAERRAATGRQILNTFSTADTIIRKLDGGQDELGYIWKVLKAPISAGMARYQQRSYQARQQIDALFKEHFGGNARLNTQKIHRSEVGGSLTHAELLAVALNTGNEDNMNRLVNGTHQIKFTEQNVQALLDNHMTDADWRFVQAFWDQINSYWGEIAANERRLTGVYPKKVDAKMMIKAPGFVRGGYYPIRYDPRLGVNVTEFSQNEVFDNLRTGRMSRAQTSHGHVDERKRAVGKPLFLSLSVGVGHINDVLFDLELREPVQSGWRLLNDQDVSQMMKRKGLEQDREALVMWLQDVAIGDRQPVEGINVVLRHLRSGLSIAKMGLSMTTIIQQPLGLLQSGVVVGNRALGKAVLKYAAHPRRYLQAALEASPFMVERWRTFERDIAVVSGMIDEDPVYSKWTSFHRAAVQVAFAAIQTTQFYMVDMPTWLAAYDSYVEKHGTTDGAVEHADQLLARAQGSGILSDRSAIERGHLSRTETFNEFARFATTFGSYMIGGKLNVAIQEIRAGQGARAAGAATVRLLYNLAILYAAESLLSQLFTGRWPDDEDEEENLAWWMAKETAFGVLGSVPLLRDTVGSLEGFDAGGAQGQALAAPANVVKGIGRIGAVALGRAEEDGLRTGVRDLMKGTGILAKLPSTQFERMLTATFERDMSVRDDFSAWDLAFGRRD